MINDENNFSFIFSNQLLRQITHEDTFWKQRMRDCCVWMWFKNKRWFSFLSSLSTLNGVFFPERISFFFWLNGAHLRCNQARMDRHKFNISTACMPTPTTTKKHFQKLLFCPPFPFHLRTKSLYFLLWLKTSFCVDGAERISFTF